MTTPATEDLLRELAPQVLGTLVRRHGRFEGCEDAVQEAVLAAAVQWPAEGVPANPRGWLTTVASRRPDHGRDRPCVPGAGGHDGGEVTGLLALMLLTHAR